MATLESAPVLAGRLGRLLTGAAVLAFVGVIAYLVVVPLIWLQATALADGGLGYRTAYASLGVAEILWTTVARAVGSVVIALALGTALAWAANGLPPRYRLLRTLPVIPMTIPTIASVIGWAFLLSPRPGYLNALLRMLPWWSDLSSGPVDVHTFPWIVIVVGLILTSFVYLFVSSGLQNINQEHVDAARSSVRRRPGSSSRLSSRSFAQPWSTALE